LLQRSEVLTGTDLQRGKSLWTNITNEDVWHGGSNCDC
jgi:hypothetical protein